MSLEMFGFTIGQRLKTYLKTTPDVYVLYYEDTETLVVVKDGGNVSYGFSASTMGAIITES